MVVEILQASLLSPNKENGMRSTSDILQMKRMKKKLAGWDRVAFSYY